MIYYIFFWHDRYIQNYILITVKVSRKIMRFWSDDIENILSLLSRILDKIWWKYRKCKLGSNSNASQIMRISRRAQSCVHAMPMGWAFIRDRIVILIPRLGRHARD